MYLKVIFFVLLCTMYILCWDSKQMEVFDLVEEVKQNFYELLNITQDASNKGICTAFKALSLKLHPDKNLQEDTNVQFRNLIYVYELLKSPTKRQYYDEVSVNGLPNWKSAVYYYRHVMKLGLIETCVVLTLYLAGWASYLERKYTFYWFADYPELVVMFERYRYYHLVSAVRCNYTSIPHYRQVGPQCGLAALAMLMKKPTKENVDDLFETAKNANFTNNGEIYSAKNMCQLASEKLTDYRVELFQGYLNCQFIKDFLLSGGHMLVPYDSSYGSGKPIFSGGQYSHWAAVSGCFETACCASAMFFVMARQGVSDLVGIWSLQVLADSNAQLELFCEALQTDGLKYKLPEGGICGPNGLKLQTVLLYPKNSNL